jgi:hypothetical protein
LFFYIVINEKNKKQKNSLSYQDYAAWRRAFRSEFGLLTSKSTQVLNSVVMFLIRTAAGLSEEVPFPNAPSPLHASAENVDIPMTSSTSAKDLMSVGSIDSWEVLEGGSPPVRSDENNSAIEENQREKARQEEVAALWIEALAFLKHVHPSYSHGRTLLQERWANLGPAATTIIQSAVRRFLAVCRVRKVINISSYYYF